MPATWTMRSLRLPPLTPPHQRPSGEAKIIQTAHDQHKVHPQHPYYPPTLTVTSRQRPVLYRVTSVQNISSRPKISHKLIQHAGTWGPHPGTKTDIRRIRRKVHFNRLTNGALHRTQQDQLYRACRRWDHLGQKPQIKWHFSAARHPTILTALTHERHLGHTGWDSTVTPSWGLRLRLPSARGRPPGRMYQVSRRHALWGIPWLGA